MRSARPILVVAGAFLVLSAATLGDFGLTWDEGVKMYDDATYADILLRIEPHDPRVLHIPGYFYVADTLRSLYAKAVRDVLPGADPVLVQHSFNALLATACLVLLYQLVLRVSGERRLAVFAALALALMPQFLGHSQNNPKDLPAALAFLWTAALVVAATARPRLRTAVAAAGVFGVALTTRVSTLLLVPILGAWLALRRRPRLRSHARSYALGLAGAAIAAIAAWPALWVHGPEVFEVAAGRFDVLRGLGVQLLYLGELHPWTDTPWHYTVVHLVAGLPLAHLLLLLAALCFARRAARVPAKADVLWLGGLWVGVLLVGDLFAPLHYDGVRHLLAALPGLAMLVAVGADQLVERLQRSEGLPAPLRRAAVALPAALAGITAVELAAVHPYQTAYLNPIAVWLGGPHTETWMEVEYWGAPYKEGAEWLNARSEKDAVVYFPIGGGQRPGEDVARYYLERPVLPRGRLAEFEDTRTPRYLMFITRVAWYDDFVREVRARYEPVFTVRRQRATLLEIYSNRSGRRN